MLQQPLLGTGPAGQSQVVRLRPACPADVKGILDVQHEGSVQALSHIFPQDQHPFPREDVRRRWQEEVDDPAVAVYVIEDGAGCTVGFAATCQDQLLHFGTATHTWGSGLAALAHDDVIARMAAGGTKRAWLRVFEDNHRARRFYARLGWRATGLRSRSPFAPHPVLLDHQLDLRPRATGTTPADAVSQAPPPPHSDRRGRPRPPNPSSGR